MNFTSILMSVCKSIKTWFRRTWQLPSNAHAYRLYIFNDQQTKFSFVLLARLRSAEPPIITRFLTSRQVIWFLFHRLTCLPTPTKTLRSARFSFQSAFSRGRMIHRFFDIPANHPKSSLLLTLTQRTLSNSPGAAVFSAAFDHIPVLAT